MTFLNRLAIAFSLILPAGLTLAGALGQTPGSAAAPATVPAPATQPAGKAVATVNGEPILESELQDGLPSDLFESSLQTAKATKLQRLVDLAVQGQFLKERHVQVSKEQLEKGMEDFTKMVMTPGCPCCGGGFENLEQFMQVNCYSLSEVRRRVTNETGFRLYADRLAAERITPEIVAQEVQARRAKIEKEFVTGAVIFFGFFQDGNDTRSPRDIAAAKEALANQACQRLANGEPFAKVAKEMSEDKLTAAAGGQVGCVPSGALDSAVGKAWRSLKSGAVSKPIKASQGYWIVQPASLTDEEVSSVVKDQLLGPVEDQVYAEYKAAREKAAIKYSGK